MKLTLKKVKQPPAAAANTVPVVRFRVTAPGCEPTRAYEGDAGFDLCSTEDTVVQQHPKKIQLGVEVEIPDGFVGLLMPRSSLLVKHNISQTIGVIDSGFRGELSSVCIKGDGTGSVVPKGTKISQLVVVPFLSAFEIVNELTPSQRGAKGFGSSGTGGNRG